MRARSTFRSFSRPLSQPARRAATLVLGCVCLWLGACSDPRPLSYAHFMEDRMSMDGVLARCNRERDETVNDLECANARRAAATYALRAERERHEELERESERKLNALRSQLATRERAAQEALAAAAAAAEAEYEAQWDPETAAVADGSLPATSDSSGSDGVDAPFTGAAPTAAQSPPE
jgi:hypothetical protein